jgi:hypothetical protein
MPGISIITNFDVNAPFPIDSRMVVSDITTRNNIIWVYEGLRVYVLSDKQSYIYQDSTWRVEYNGIYGGSGSLPGNVSVDFGSFGNTVGTSSYYFQYEVDSQSNFLYLQNQFIRNRATTVANSWQGVEFRQQLKYNDGTGLKNSSYISFNPSTNGINSNLAGGIAFGVGYSTSFPEKEAMRISPSGFVGIGTNDPKDFLQIGSSSTSKNPIVIGDSYIGYNYYVSNNTQTYFQNSVGSGAILFSADGDIKFRTRNSSSSPDDIMILVDKKVGIGTTEPLEILQIGNDSGNQLPLVLHNRTEAAIGHNWYYGTGTTDLFIDNTKGSERIKFNNGEILFSTREANSGSFNPTMILKNSFVGVNNTNPQDSLDVIGNILASLNITANLDVKSNRLVQTTTGYFFKNSPNNKITSGSEMDFFVNNALPNLKIFQNKTVTYQDFHVEDKFLLIYNTTGNLNSKLDKGIVFGEPRSQYGSVIYPYQGASIGEMGLSIYSKSSGFEVESLRISNGGKRIQIGVPSNTSAGPYNFNSTTTVNSQIDTSNDMYVFDTTRISASVESDLIKSGYVTFTVSFGSTVYVHQYWIRIGKIVQVQLRAFTTVAPPADVFQLPNVFITIPIGKAVIDSIRGNFRGYRRAYTIATITTPSSSVNGIIVAYSSFAIKFKEGEGGDSDQYQPATFMNEIYGSYTYEIVN